MSKFYAGIGSRETPKHVLEYMTSVAEVLREKGYTLRSGGAGGADTAFERGAGLKEIYVPWTGFSGSNAPDTYALTEQPPEVIQNCLRLASNIHPAWHRCSSAARHLHGRNILQIFGLDDTPVDFVVYWSKYDKRANPKGGTATAVNLARNFSIPTFNLNIPEQKQAFENQFIKRK